MGSEAAPTDFLEQIISLGDAGSGLLELYHAQQAELAFAQRKATGVVSFCKTIEGLRGQNVETVNDCLHDALQELAGGDQVAVYYMCKGELCGLEPSDGLLYDGFRCRRMDVEAGLEQRLPSADEAEADPADEDWMAGESVPVHVVRIGNGVVIEDCESDPRFQGDKAWAQAELKDAIIGSVACAPVREEDGTVLAIVQTARSKGSFTKNDLDLLQVLCELMRVTIRKILPDAIIDALGSNIKADKQSKAAVASLVQNAMPNEHRDTRSGRADTRISRLQQQPMKIERAPNTAMMFDPTLATFEFNVWDYSENDLVRFTVGIMQDLQLLKQFDIPAASLTNFVLGCRKRYWDNPFHNWFHGFSVFQFAYASLKHTEAVQYMQSQDVLALLVSSLCHDIDHPGNTNSFETSSCTSRAMIYNDISVLENHHAHTLFLVLYGDRNNILSNCDKDTKNKLRKSMVQAILSTDMAHHFDFLKSMDEVKVLSTRTMTRLQLQGITRSRLQFDPSNEKDRQKIINMLIHTCDLSGQASPWAVAAVWEERIAMEFNKQADMEKEMGFPVLPHMDGLDNLQHRYKMQVNFIDYVLDPWWKAVVRLFPALEPCFGQLKQNRMKFHHMSQSPQKQETRNNMMAAIRKKNEDDS